MIDLTRGDILQADAEALVNTVNCVGVMGRGIALQFRKAFPENFRVYEAACEHEEVRPGQMLVFETTSKCTAGLVPNATAVAPDRLLPRRNTCTPGPPL